MYHILGAGAVGCLWAGRLARAGRSVELLLRDQTWAAIGSPDSVVIAVQDCEGVKRSSTTAEASESCRTGHADEDVNTWSVSVPVAPAGKAGAISNLLVATKANDVAAAMESVQGRLTPSQSRVVMLCNGMGYSTGKAVEQQLVASSTHGCFMRERFNVVHTGFGEVHIGPAPGATVDPGALATVALELQIAGLAVSAVDDMLPLLWRKLAANAALNGATALVGCKNGAMVESSEGRRFVELICHEVSAVMVGGLTGEELTEYALEVARSSAENYSSMYQDMVHGRPTEIDYINGHVVRCSHSKGVQAATNQAVLSLVKLKEQMSMERRKHHRAQD